MLVIALLVGLCYWLVWPVGEYAILDDWAFNKSLSFLNERGELRILHWNPMSLMGHVLWGWLLGDTTAPRTLLEAHLLTGVLLEHSASPLRYCAPSKGRVHATGYGRQRRGDRAHRYGVALECGARLGLGFLECHREFFSGQRLGHQAVVGST